MSIDREYIKLMDGSRSKRTQKIPICILPELIRDQKLYKAVCVYLELKSVFYNGEFYNARSNHNSISKYLWHSPGAVRYKLKLLEEYGFIHYNKKGTMFLCSWLDLVNSFGFEYKTIRNIKFFRYKDRSWLDLLCRRILLEMNYKSQEKIIEMKIVESDLLYTIQNRLLTMVREIDNSLIATKDKQRQRAPLLSKLNELQIYRFTGSKTKAAIGKRKKKGLFGAIYIDAMRGYFEWIKGTENGTINKLPSVNFDICIGTKKTAQIFGLSSGSSGWYWQKILELNSLIKVESRFRFINRPRHYVTEDTTFKLFPSKYKGCCRRLPNKFTFIPLK